MKFKNECSGPIYIKSIGKQVGFKLEFESEQTDEIRTLVREAKLSIVEEKIDKKKDESKLEETYVKSKDVEAENSYKEHQKTKKKKSVLDTENMESE